MDYRIRPAEEQFQAQQTRWNDLAGYLLAEVKIETGRPVSSWLQGSYKFGTQVRPASMGEEFDIDLGLYVEWAGEPEDGEHGPLDLRDIVQAKLASYVADEGNEATKVADPKPRCARIHFKDDFHIDVPTYHLDRAADCRALATADDRWERSDPKSIYLWWKNEVSSEARPRARRIVRYLKMWAALTFKEAGRPSSILLTVLVGDALNALDLSAVSGDDEVFSAVVTAILRRLQDNRVVPNPADRNENLNRLTEAETDALVKALATLKEVGQRALRASTQIEAAEVWSEAFLHFFPMPENEGAAQRVEQGGAVAVLAIDPVVRVIATVLGRKMEGINRIGPIPKGCDLRFQLLNTNLPEGVLVRWTVRNGGAEAEALNDLGHVGPTTGLLAEETSAYRGTHHMDVVVMFRGQVLGRRRVPVMVTGLGIPKRNAARPAWTRLR